MSLRWSLPCPSCDPGHSQGTDPGAPLLSRAAPGLREGEKGTSVFETGLGLSATWPGAAPGRGEPSTHKRSCQGKRSPPALRNHSATPKAPFCSGGSQGAPSPPCSCPQPGRRGPTWEEHGGQQLRGLQQAEDGPLERLAAAGLQVAVKREGAASGGCRAALCVPLPTRWGQGCYCPAQRGTPPPARSPNPPPGVHPLPLPTAAGQAGLSGHRRHGLRGGGLVQPRAETPTSPLPGQPAPAPAPAPHKENANLLQEVTSCQNS